MSHGYTAGLDELEVGLGWPSKYEISPLEGEPVCLSSCKKCSGKDNSARIIIAEVLLQYVIDDFNFTRCRLYLTNPKTLFFERVVPIIDTQVELYQSLSLMYQCLGKYDF